MDETDRMKATEIKQCKLIADILIERALGAYNKQTITAVLLFAADRDSLSSPQGWAWLAPQWSKTNRQFAKVPSSSSSCHG